MSNREESLFVLRRAWLAGRCRRADVNRAFNTERSPNRAGSIMQQALNDYPDHLFRKPYKGVLPNVEVGWPDNLISNWMQELAQGKALAKEVLGPSDKLKFIGNEPLNKRPPSEYFARLIMQAGIAGEPVYITYVNQQRKSLPRRRLVLPLAIEHTGFLWTLHAQDMERPDYPLRVFLLGRISSVETVERGWRKPHDFVWKNPNYYLKATEKRKVTLSTDMTPEQRKAVKTTFGIDDESVLHIQSHSVFNFERLYVNNQIDSNIVWPIFITFEPINKQRG